MLDLLRGVAAVMVMLFHCGQAAGSGYLAVDFFFGLSGFVMAHAYQARLRDGLGVTRFFVLRLVRVYPMFVVGAVLAVLLSHGSPVMLFMLPESVSATSMDYPSNPPLWSLIYELAINLVWALALPWLSLRLRWLVVIASGGVLAYGIAAHGIADLPGYGLRVARVTFSFLVGTIMHDAYAPAGSPRQSGAIAWGLPLALAAMLLPAPADPRIWEGLAVFALMPAVLWLGIRWTVPDEGLSNLFGDLSFPLYCIHGPIVIYALEHHLPLPAAAALIVMLALILSRHVDHPAQAWFKRRIASAKRGMTHQDGLIGAMNGQVRP